MHVYNVASISLLSVQSPLDMVHMVLQSYMLDVVCYLGVEVGIEGESCSLCGPTWLYRLSAALLYLSGC